MAARFSSSTILRSALVAHISLSGTSLLSSTFGPSQFQLPTTTTTTSTNSQNQQTPSSPCHDHHHGNSNNNNNNNDMANICAALPWLDQLHNMIASMYINGVGVGAHNKQCCIGTISPPHPQHTNVMVQIGKDVCFENPIVSYAGAVEMERSFRGRLLLHLQNDVKTVLECINVEASEDSICGGTQQNNGTSPSPSSSSSHSPLVPSTTNNNVSSSSPPNVEVTYRLSQHYGSHFSIHSLLVVTVHVRRGSPNNHRSGVRRITPQKVPGVPLATSGLTPRAASTVVAVASAAVVTATNNGCYPASLALVAKKAASKIAEATTATTAKVGRDTGDSSSSASSSASSMQVSSSPLVAEIVRIEERWNGVQLIHFAPFHWSRRLNGLVAGGAAFLFFR